MTRVVKGLGLAAALIFLTGAVAWADGSTLTIRSLFVYKQKNSLGFARTPEIPVVVQTEGQAAQTVTTPAGEFKVTVPRSGRTWITLPPYEDLILEPLMFGITFSADGTSFFYHDYEGVAPKDNPVVLYQNDDGTYFLEFRDRRLGFFKPQPNLHAPIMGLSADVYGGPPVVPQVWDKEQYLYGAGQYITTWEYGEPENQPVQLEVTWRYPDGREKVYTLPLPAILTTPEGIYFETDSGYRDHKYGDLPFKLIHAYPGDFTINLKPGWYQVSYRLVDPDGNKSNPREHPLYIKSPEEWYP